MPGIWGGVLDTPQSNILGTSEPTSLDPSNVQFGTPVLTDKIKNVGDYLDEYMSPEDKAKKKKEEDEKDKNWLTKYKTDNNMINYLA
jgi:hypothetical protein